MSAETLLTLKEFCRRLKDQESEYCPPWDEVNDQDLATAKDEQEVYAILSCVAGYAGAHGIDNGVFYDPEGFQAVLEFVTQRIGDPNALAILKQYYPTQTQSSVAIKLCLP